MIGTKYGYRYKRTATAHDELPAVVEAFDVEKPLA